MDLKLHSPNRHSYVVVGMVYQHSVEDLSCRGMASDFLFTELTDASCGSGIVFQPVFLLWSGQPIHGQGRVLEGGHAVFAECYYYPRTGGIHSVVDVVRTNNNHRYGRHDIDPYFPV